MKKKINIVQFTPYFPPHHWGLETVSEQWGTQRVKSWYWKVLHVTFSPWQKSWVTHYSHQWFNVIVLPAFNVVNNFPFPKFRKKSFWKWIQKIKKFHWDIYVTHTRFFLSTFLGALLAKKHKKKLIHIEHGSGYVTW